MRDDGILHQDVAVGAVEDGEILDVLGWPKNSFEPFHTLLWKT